MSEKDKEILEDAVNENIGTNDENVQESTGQENAGEENVEPENTELTSEERVQKELDEANEKIAMLKESIQKLSH